MTGRQKKETLETFIKLLRCADSVRGRVHKHLKTYGLNDTQFGVLEILLHKGDLSQKEIGKKILKAKSSITSVIENLENRSLISKCADEEDKRKAVISLTDKGRELITNVFEKHRDVIVEDFSVLTEKESDELGRLCKKLGIGGEKFK